MVRVIAAAKWRVRSLEGFEAEGCEPAGVKGRKHAREGDTAAKGIQDSPLQYAVSMCQVRRMKLTGTVTTTLVRSARHRSALS